MKRAMLLSAFLCCVTLAQSQTKLYITKTDGSVDSLVLSQVKSISFRGPTAARLTLNGTWDYSWGDVATRKGTFYIEEKYGTVTGSADAGSAIAGTFNSQTSYLSLYFLPSNTLSSQFIHGVVSADMKSLTGTYYQGQYISYPVTATRR